MWISDLKVGTVLVDFLSLLIFVTVEKYEENLGWKQQYL